MKKLFLFIVVILSVTLNGYSQGWIKQESPTDSYLKSVYFVTPNIGFIVGFNGVLLKTVDGGNHWVAKNSGTTKNLLSVYFIDLLNGFILSSDELLKTTDGGESWFVQESIGIGIDAGHIQFVNTDTGFIAGTGFFLKTTDKGKSWIKQNMGNTNHGAALGLWAVNSQVVYIACGGGWVYKSTDSGDNWFVSLSNSAGATIDEDVYFTNQDTGFVIGGNWAQGSGNGLIFKTTNGGVNWSLTHTPDAMLHSICFLNDTMGYIVGEHGTILKTTDGGNHWLDLNSKVNSTLSSVFFINTLTGYAVGSNGTILKTINGGISSNIKLVKEENCAEFFPNPVKDILTVKTKKNREGELSIIDMTGILRYKNHIQDPTTNIDLSNLKQGTYILKFVCEEEVETIKMIKE